MFLSAILPTLLHAKPSVLNSQQSQLVVRWNISNKARWVKNVSEAGKKKIVAKPRPTKTPVFRLMSAYMPRLCKFVQVVEFCIFKDSCLDY